MKKFFPVLLTLFLLLLIGGNLFLLYLLGQGIWGQRIVRVDTMPEWQKMTSHLPEDLHNGKVYKIKDPDAALFFDKKNPGEFFYVDRARHILRVHNAANEIAFTFTDLQNKAYFVDWVELKKDPDRVLEVTWRNSTYFDFNGDMIFDLQLPARSKDPCLYSENGKWKPCKVLSLKEKKIKVGNTLYIFRNSQWQKISEIYP